MEIYPSFPRSAFRDNELTLSEVREGRSVSTHGVLQIYENAGNPPGRYFDYGEREPLVGAYAKMAGDEATSAFRLIRLIGFSRASFRVAEVQIT